MCRREIWVCSSYVAVCFVWLLYVLFCFFVFFYSCVITGKTGRVKWFIVRACRLFWSLSCCCCCRCQKMQVASFSQLPTVTTFSVRSLMGIFFCILKKIYINMSFSSKSSSNRVFILDAARRRLACLTQCLQPASFTCDRYGVLPWYMDSPVLKIFCGVVSLLLIQVELGYWRCWGGVWPNRWNICCLACVFTVGSLGMTVRVLQCGALT